MYKCFNVTSLVGSYWEIDFYFHRIALKTCVFSYAHLYILHENVGCHRKSGYTFLSHFRNSSPSLTAELYLIQHVRMIINSLPNLGDEPNTLLFLKYQTSSNNAHLGIWWYIIQICKYCICKHEKHTKFKNININFW